MQKKNIRFLPEQGGARNGPKWLTTFNDMATLLMVFFVLLFTMGSVDVMRYKNFRNSLQSAMGVLNEGRHAPVGLIDEDDFSMSQDLADEKAAPDGPRADGDAAAEGQALEGLGRTQGLEAEYTPNKGIKLTLNDRILFRSGEAGLTPAGYKLLGRVAAAIRPLNRNIRVEGHTDNVPIRTARYPSNWELSTARAISVIKFFIHRGGIDPRRLSAAGYADAKPRVLNNSSANRARNRRVEIILQRRLSPPADQLRHGFGKTPREG